MSDAEKIHRWLTQEELDTMLAKARAEVAYEIYESLGALDPMIYDANTVRAALRIAHDHFRPEDAQTVAP
jgi:protoheme ferro-lyase